MKVKFNDIKKSFLEIKDKLDDKLNNIFYEKCNFINGDNVKEFEENFSTYTGSKYCIGVNSGTDAIKLALRSLNIKEGSEVLVQNNTFIGSILGASELKLKIKLVDNKEDYTIDINDLEKKISKETSVLILVHLYGYCSDIEKILELKRKYNFFLIEDCAQAHGCKYKNKHVGNFGEMGCFSFYPGKNLGASGDGGCVVTNNKHYYHNLKILRNLGSEKKYYHIIKGYNSRLDTLQAIVLNEKLKFLEKNNQKRREIANQYNENLRTIKEIILPQVKDFCLPVWHLFIIRLKNKIIRDELLLYLKSKDIEVSIHYPVSICNLDAYEEIRNLDFSNDFSNLILSLPMHPYLIKEEINYVCSSIKEYFLKA